MNYKRIFKSRKLRNKLLQFLSWIPDKAMLKLQYRIKFGRKLNLKNPRRYTEKLQCYKLNYRNPLMVTCTDKFEVRSYLNDCGFQDMLVNCYGVFDSVEEINYETLPQSFVLKDTLGSGGNSVIICKDKNTFSFSTAKKQMEEWVKTPIKKSGGREWPYYSGKNPRIIIEEYLDSNAENGLTDYKFFCFNGKFEYIYVLCDRVLGKHVKLGIYNKNLEKLNVYRNDELPLHEEIEFPDNISEMIEKAEKISASFPHARVDMYNENGKILFGEVTFFDGSGYMSYDPDSFDFEIGSKFDLSC